MQTIWRSGFVAICGLLAVVAGADTQQQAAPPAQTPSATGAISGVVVHAVTGEPVADALVEVGWPGEREYPDFVRPQLTDARGRFVFTNLPASARITVRATKSGFLPNAAGSSILERAATAPIVLTDGEWFQNARIPLWPPASISGTVRDEGGEPLIGVFVRLLAQVRVGAAMRWAAGNVVLTDDRGAYRIGMLAAGTYFVMVPSVQHSLPADATAANTLSPETVARYRDQGRSLPAVEPMVDIGPASRLLINGYPVPPPPVEGKPFTYPMTFAGGASVASATPVTVATGEIRTAVDITLNPVPSAQLSGMVEGTGNANVVLRLLPDGLDELGAGSEAATTLTRPDGSFTFPNVPAGNYVIDAPLGTHEFVIGSMGLFYSPTLPNPPVPRGGSRIGGGIDAAGFGFIESPFQSKVWARTPVTVSAAGVSNVVVTLRPALSVSGRLQTETSANRPVPRTPARYLHIQSAAGDARIGTTYNRDSARVNDGSFAITGLLPGAHLFYANETGWMIKSVVVNGRDHTYTPLNLESSIENIVVTFTNAVPTLSGSVSGIDAARPVSVLAFPAEPAQWTDYGLRPQRIKVADVSTTGTFRFANLPAGRYHVIALPAARSYDWRQPGYFERAAPLASLVTLNWGEEQHVTLKVSNAR